MNSTFANVTEQRRPAGSLTVAIPPHDAGPRRIINGARARVWSAGGEFQAPAAVDERNSDISGGAVYHDNRVEIEVLP